MLPIIDIQEGTSHMPFSKVVSEMMMEPSSDYTITPVKKKNFPIKTPKLFINPIKTSSHLAVFVELYISYITININELPSTIEDLLDCEDRA